MQKAAVNSMPLRLWIIGSEPSHGEGESVLGLWGQSMLNLEKMEFGEMHSFVVSNPLHRF